MANTAPSISKTTLRAGTQVRRGASASDVAESLTRGIKSTAIADLSRQKAQSLQKLIRQEEAKLTEEIAKSFEQRNEEKADRLSLYYEELTNYYYSASTKTAKELKADVLPLFDDLVADINKDQLLNKEEKAPLLDIVKKTTETFNKRLTLQSRLIESSKKIIGSAAREGLENSGIGILFLAAFDIYKKRKETKLEKQEKQEATENAKREARIRRQARGGEQGTRQSTLNVAQPAPASPRIMSGPSSEPTELEIPQVSATQVSSSPETPALGDDVMDIPKTTQVKPYTRKDGIEVAGHTRRRPYEAQLVGVLTQHSKILGSILQISSEIKETLVFQSKKIENIDRTTSKQLNLFTREFEKRQLTEEEGLFESSSSLKLQTAQLLKAENETSSIFSNLGGLGSLFGGGVTKLMGRLMGAALPLIGSSLAVLLAGGVGLALGTWIRKEFDTDKYIKKLYFWFTGQKETETDEKYVRGQNQFDSEIAKRNAATFFERWGKGIQMGVSGTPIQTPDAKYYQFEEDIALRQESIQKIYEDIYKTLERGETLNQLQQKLLESARKTLQEDTRDEMVAFQERLKDLLNVGDLFEDISHSFQSSQLNILKTEDQIQEVIRAIGNRETGSVLSPEHQELLNRSTEENKKHALARSTLSRLEPPTGVKRPTAVQIPSSKPSQLSPDVIEQAGYNTTYNPAEKEKQEQLRDGKPLTEMTLSEVLEYQKRLGPDKNAVGRYQFVQSTLFGDDDKSGLVGQLKLPMNTVFTPEIQEQLNEKLTRQNIAQLRRFKIPVTPSNVYGAHYLGVGGLQAVVEAAETTPEMTVEEAFKQYNEAHPERKHPLSIGVNKELENLLVGNFASEMALRLGQAGFRSDIMLRGRDFSENNNTPQAKIMRELQNKIQELQNTPQAKIMRELQDKMRKLREYRERANRQRYTPSEQQNTVTEPRTFDTTERTTFDPLSIYNFKSDKGIFDFKENPNQEQSSIVLPVTDDAQKGRQELTNTLQAPQSQMANLQAPVNLYNVNNDNRISYVNPQKDNDLNVTNYDTTLLRSLG